MKKSPHFRYNETLTTLLIAAAMSLGTGKVAGQTVFTVNNLAPIVSTGASVSITAPDTLYQNAGPVSDNITAVTFDTNIYFLSTAAGSANPGFQFNGAITGSPITAGTNVAISYDFTLQKNESIASTVNWTLTFSGSENPAPITIGSGSLGAIGAASQTFSGVYNNYNFVNGSSASGSPASTFTAALQLSYDTGIVSVQPLVTISMIDSGYGGQGITIGGATAVPEPATYAAIAGVVMLSFAFWRRRRPVSVGT